MLSAFISTVVIRWLLFGLSKPRVLSLPYLLDDLLRYVFSLIGCAVSNVCFVHSLCCYSSPLSFSTFVFFNKTFGACGGSHGVLAGEFIDALLGAFTCGWYQELGLHFYRMETETKSFFSAHFSLRNCGLIRMLSIDRSIRIYYLPK